MKKKMNKLLALILSTVIAVGVLPGGVITPLMAIAAGTPDTNWYTTGLSSYSISNADELAGLAEIVNSGEDNFENKTITLTDNIDLSDFGSDAGWTPIGTGSNRFQGHFDGDGFQISGLKINKSSNEYGLFGYVENGSIVKLGVENAEISARLRVGGIAGSIANSDIKNCWLTGSVSGSNGTVGGIAGQVTGSSSIENCWFSGSVSSSNNIVGGIAGSVAAAGGITNCYSKGSVSGGNLRIGGIVGNMTNGSIKNCYSTSSISCTNHIAGGIAGEFTGDSIENCAALNPYIEYSGSNVGRVAGKIGTSSELKANTAFSGMLDGPDGDPISVDNDPNDQNGADITVDEIIKGDIWTGNLGWDESVWLIQADNLPILLNTGAEQDYTVPEYMLGSDSEYFTGRGVAGDPYLINTAEDLAKLAELVNSGDADHNSKHYKLTDSIDLSDYQSGSDWTPIGENSLNSFRGEFDGGNNVLSGLYVNNPELPYMGLFGYVYNGTVKKLGVESGNVTGNFFAGSIVGYLDNSSLEYCFSTGSVTGIYNSGTPNAPYNGGHVGGLVGHAASASKIEYCYNTGNISGRGGVGGIVGYLQTGSVEKCFGTGDITGSAGSAGGVAGSVQSGNVQNCYAAGDISGAEPGGIAGSVNGGSIETCYSTSAVSSTFNVTGGIAGSIIWADHMSGCAALNPHILGTSTIGRLTGNDYSTTLANNVAFEGILNGPAGQKLAGGNSGDWNGANVTKGDLGKAEFWVKDLEWDETVWVIETGKLPVLRNLTGQSGDMPEHLTYDFNGEGTEISPYLIYTAEELDNVRLFMNAHYKLMDDIDLEDYLDEYGSMEGWNPIGTMYDPFKGNFDGNGKIIKGMYINDTTLFSAGLFGWVEGKIHNLGVEDVNVTGDENVGGITGMVYKGSIENCYVTGSVDGSKHVGGISGYVSGSTVKNCFSTSSVNASDSRAGGIAGEVVINGTVDDCYATGSVSGNTINGGIAGYVNGSTVRNCYASASGGGIRFGGIAGQSDGIITNCYYDSEASKAASGVGNGSSDSVFPLTTEEMTNDSVLDSGSAMAGLNANGTWSQPDKTADYVHYPTLKVFEDSEAAVESVQVRRREVSLSNVAATLTYGQQLQESTITGDVKYQGNEVFGVWNWVNGNIRPEVINTGYDITFTPQYPLYKQKTERITVNVTKSPGGSGGGGGTSYYTVTFNTNGGTDIAKQSVQQNGKAVKPADPTREGYIFTGWFTDSALTSEYDFDSAVTSNRTLYAGWEEGGGSSSGTPTPPGDLEDYAELPFISGYLDGTFAPDNQISRAEAAQVLYNIALIDGQVRVDLFGTFPDVPEDAWYYTAVGNLAGWSIINGYEDGMFRPDEAITRAEFTAMAMRYAGINASGGNVFDDVPSGHWASGVIAAAVNSGYVSGYPDGTFRPEDPMTRAEIIAVMARILSRSESFEQNVTFRDLTANHWAYTIIMNAANGVKK